MIDIFEMFYPFQFKYIMHGKVTVRCILSVSPIPIEIAFAYDMIIISLHFRVQTESNAWMGGMTIVYSSSIVHWQDIVNSGASRFKIYRSELRNFGLRNILLMEFNPIISVV